MSTAQGSEDFYPKLKMRNIAGYADPADLLLVTKEEDDVEVEICRCQLSEGQQLINWGYRIYLGVIYIYILVSDGECRIIKHLTYSSINRMHSIKLPFLIPYMTFFFEDGGLYLVGDSYSNPLVGLIIRVR